MMKGYTVHHAVTICFFAGAALAVKYGVGPNTLLVALSILHLATLVALERALPHDPRISALQDPQTTNDVAHLATYSAARAVLSAFGVFALARGNGGEGLLHLWPHSLPFVLQCATALVLWELASYARHRLMHENDFFWRAHELHHDIRELHTFKAVRVHFLDDLCAIPFELAVPLVFGGPPEAYLWVFVWNVVFGNLIHANIDQRNPWWLHYLIPTAQLHRIHHAQGSMRRNLAGSLPAIDLLCGTFLHPDRVRTDAMGIPDAALPMRFTAQLLRPFRRIA